MSKEHLEFETEHTALDIIIKWLALLLCICEVPSVNLGYSNRSSVPSRNAGILN